MSKTASTPASSPYIPTEREQRSIDAVADRKRKRMPRPSVKVSAARAEIDHAEPAVGWALMLGSMGLDDERLVTLFIHQLANLSQKDGVLEESTLNANIALVQGIAPNDPVEAIIATQMAAIHGATMMMAKRLRGVETLQQQDSASNSLNKLARTFAVQVEALKRYRTSGQQSVIVKHVTVNDGGQAIVGSVNPGEGSR